MKVKNKKMRKLLNAKIRWEDKRNQRPYKHRVASNSENLTLVHIPLAIAALGVSSLEIQKSKSAERKIVNFSKVKHINKR